MAERIATIEDAKHDAKRKRAEAFMAANPPPKSRPKSKSKKRGIFRRKP
jgi:hypothetical protein